MKTITTLLMTSLLLAGTFNMVFAGENGRRNQPRMEARFFERHPNFNRRVHLSFRALSVNACPVCYNPLHDGQLDCSLEDLAWMETNRIAQALELSDHQRNRVFEINYRYNTHCYNGEYYPTTRRDREIRHILHLGQVIAFAILLNELHHGEVCCNCSNEAY